MMENPSAEELTARCRQLEENLAHVREQIAQAAAKAGRDPGEVTLLAATKTVPAAVICRAVELGVTDIGENRVQELLEKYEELPLGRCRVHLIGHLQTNKAGKAADKVCMVQSVDSARLAKALDREMQKAGRPLDVLIEVNIGREQNKSGVLPEAAEALADEIAACENLRLCGLMAIPPVCEERGEARGYFRAMHKLFLDMKDKKSDNRNMHILSMGMSDDFQDAILEGATMVRVGSALFGKRNYQK